MRKHSVYTPYIAAVAALILAGLIALAHQRAYSKGRADFLTTFIREAVVAPGSQLARRVSDACQRNFLTPHQARALVGENQRLKAQTAALSLENQDLKADAQDAVRLRKMLGLPPPRPWKRIAALVISLKPNISRDTAVIRIGKKDPGEPRDVAIDPGGNLVGQVTRASSGICDVLLATDMQFSAGARVIQTGRSPAPKTVTGICQGNRGDSLILSDMPLDSDVRPGDLVQTSGLGSVFPAGIPIGTVVSVSSDQARSIKSAQVRINADLNDLREVYVLR